MTVRRPPVARRVPETTALHGDVLVDDYAWLREKTNPEVTAYLEAENAWVTELLAPTGPLQETLYREMVSHLKETDLTVPYRDGAFLWYARTEEGKQYPIQCRKRESLDAPEEVTLDLNALAMENGAAFLDLGAYEPNDDGSLLAYSLDARGFRQYTLFVKDLAAGRLLPLRVGKTVSAAWAADGVTLFYTVEDEANRPYRLYRHRLGTAAHGLVFEETDERFSLDVARTRSGSFLVLVSASHTASEVHLLPADRPEGEWRVVCPRRDDHEYDLDHRGDRLYIRTNDTGRNFRLVSAPVDDPSPARWTELVPHRADVMLEGVDAFADHLVLHERERGLPRLRVEELRTGLSHRVAFSEPVYALFPEENRVFQTTLFRYRYESLVTPGSVFDYDMETRVATLRKRTEVPGGFDPAHYRSERVEATAPDGTRIPVSLVTRADFRSDGSSPMLLLGYGAYGYPVPIGFSPARLSLLDRGVALAFAHVRGGGEMGKAWHDAGRMARKPNTFTDFIAVADHLVASRHTSRDRLVIEGRSAGGLLIGAVLNLRPDLAAAALLTVPFVDVVNTMRDPTLPLTVGEYEEWGNPQAKDEYELLKSYCPYTNLRGGSFPALLLQTSLHDSQVMFWEPAKYVAKLRTLTNGGNPILLKTNMAAGHGGASGRYDHLREKAFEYAFILWRLGLHE